MGERNNFNESLYDDLLFPQESIPNSVEIQSNPLALEKDRDELRTKLGECQRQLAMVIQEIEKLKQNNSCITRTAKLELERTNEELREENSRKILTECLQENHSYTMPNQYDNGKSKIQKIRQ